MIDVADLRQGRVSGPANWFLQNAFFNPIHVVFGRFCGDLDRICNPLHRPGFSCINDGEDPAWRFEAANPGSTW